MPKAPGRLRLGAQDPEVEMGLEALGCLGSCGDRRLASDRRLLLLEQVGGDWVAGGWGARGWGLKDGGSGPSAPLPSPPCSIHNGVIAVFQRKGLPDQELFGLNEGVR